MNIPSPRAVPLVLATGLLGLLLGAGCAPRPATRPGSVMRGGTGAPVAVETAVVQAQPLRETLLLSGELSAPRSVDLRPTQSGRLEALEREDGTPIEEGSVVRRGEPVARLDRRESAANRALAEAALLTARVNLEDRRRERDRSVNLFREGSLTEQRRDAAVTAYELARAAVAQAEAQLDLASVRHDETLLRAPMDGVVVLRSADPGALVSPTTPLLRIAALDPLQFLVDLPARRLTRIEPGSTPVDVRVDLYPDRVFRGLVRRVFPTVDPATRTVRAEVLLDNPPEAPGALGPLRPGLYASAEIVLAAREAAVVVPFDAVVRSRGRHSVFVVRGERAEARTVTLGLRSGELQEVVAGLEPGETLVVVGQHRLTDGSGVRVVDARAPRAAADEEDRP